MSDRLAIKQASNRQQHSNPITNYRSADAHGGSQLPITNYQLPITANFVKIIQAPLIETLGEIK